MVCHFWSSPPPDDTSFVEFKFSLGISSKSCIWSCSSSRRLVPLLVFIFLWFCCASALLLSDWWWWLWTTYIQCRQEPDDDLWKTHVCELAVALRFSLVSRFKQTATLQLIRSTPHHLWHRSLLIFRTYRNLNLNRQWATRRRSRYEYSIKKIARDNRSNLLSSKQFICKWDKCSARQYRSSSSTSSTKHNNASSCRFINIVSSWIINISDGGVNPY